MEKEELNQRLEQLLKGLDSQINPLDEHQIHTEIRQLKDEETESTEEWVIEGMAFYFDEGAEELQYGWNTFFGPISSFKSQDGKIHTIPSLDRFDCKTIQYWEARLNSVKHPVLKARYSGLVWEFSKMKCGKGASHKVAESFISSIIELSGQNLQEQPTRIIGKLKKAQSLAISLRNDRLLEKTNNAIIEFEDKVADDKKPGFFGFSYDLLVENKNSKVTDEQKDKIIQDLENRLKRIITLGDPFCCESVALRLGNYYRKIGNDAEMIRVLSEYKNVFEAICKEAEPLQAQIFYEKIYEVFKSFNLNDHLDDLLIKIKELGPQVNESLKTISHSLEVPREEMESFSKTLTEGTLRESVGRIAGQFLVRKEEIKKQITEIQEQAPLSFLIPKTIQDHQGRPVANVGSIVDDLEGNVILQMEQYISLSIPFLRNVLEVFFETHSLTAEKLSDLICGSPIILDESKGIILRGLQAYFDQDYLVAAHLLIPQFESAIRNLIELSGGNILGRNRFGGFKYRPLDDLLREKLIEKCFDTNEVGLYFRVLYTDQRGLNWRNKICHGLAFEETFNVALLDRLIHSYLLLSLLKKEAS